VRGTANGYGQQFRPGPQVRLAAGLAAFTLVTAGCGDDAENGGGGGGAESITVAITSPCIPCFPQPYIASELGYFEEEGLEVEIIAQLPGAAAGTALTNGDIQIGGVTSDWTVPYHAQETGKGDPVSMFIVDGMWVDQMMVLGDSPYQAAGDLVGHRIGVSEAKDEEVAHLLMSTVGVEDPTSYETIVVGGRAPAAVAMDDGRIEAFVGTYADEFAMKSAGFDIKVLSAGGTEDFYNNGWAASPAYMEENPDVIVGFGRAVAKAAVWMNTNPEAVIDLLKEAAPEAVEDPESALALVKATVAHNTERYENRFESEASRWADVVNYFAEQGTIDEAYDPEVFFTNEYLDDIWDFDMEEIVEAAEAGA
jgi:NitT/TauT family transport system substrate-binding protein